MLRMMTMKKAMQVAQMRIILTWANNGNIMECALLPLTFAKQPCKIGTMKMKNKTITTWLIRAYMVYSVTADIIVIGGIVWLILN